MKFILFLLDWLGWERISETRARHNDIINRLKIMAENQAELAGEIRTFKETVKAGTAKVLKATQEVSDKIKRLEGIIAAGGPITQELKDLAAELNTAGTELTAAAQAADDVVPDAPPAEEPPAQ